MSVSAYLLKTINFTSRIVPTYFATRPYDSWGKLVSEATAVDGGIRMGYSLFDVVRTT